MASQAWCQKERVKKKTRVLGIFLTVLFRVIEAFSDFIFWLIHKKSDKVPLPPIDNFLLLESASSLATKIRTQKVNDMFQYKFCF